MKQTRDWRKAASGSRWAIGYLLFIGAVGLMYLERRSTMTSREHELALLGIVGLFFALFWVWLKVEECKWR